MTVAVRVRSFLFFLYRKHRG